MQATLIPYCDVIGSVMRKEIMDWFMVKILAMKFMRVSQKFLFHVNKSWFAVFFVNSHCR